MASREILGWEDVGYNPDVSGDEIIGDDLDAILGAGRRRQQRRPAPQQPRNSPQRQRPHSPYGVDEKTMGEMRELPIGFDSVTAVVKSTSTKLTQRPQVLFRPERLSIDDTLSAFFTVDDLKVGNKSQLVSSGSLPASTFSSKAFGMRLKMDTADPAIDVVLSITNIDAAADHRFLAALIGPALSK